MDNSIVMIVANSAIYEKAKEVVKRHGEDIPIYFVKMKDAVGLAKEKVSKGAKVIISRGGIGIRLRQNLDCPVVLVKYTYFDFAGAIQKAKAYEGPIAIVSFDPAIESAKKVKELLDDNIALIRITHNDNIETVVKNLVDRGFKILIGGITVSEIAKQYNIKTVMIEADEEPILEAFEEARHYLRIINERELRFQMINSIINCVSEGIIAVDTDGRITNINAAAMKLFQEVMRESDFSNVSKVEALSSLLKTAKSGESHFEELVDVGNTSLVINSVPIKVQNNPIGAVGTIQEVKQIQSIESKVRRLLMVKGHVAKKGIDDIIGSSKSIAEAKGKAMDYAFVDSTVMILGETGTGKELFAQSIHNASRRKNKPFVAINCAALPKSIIESELFGYVKGAFTGASSEGKAGMFEMAHGGTIFLDEISEMPIDVQGRLLRVIQEKEIVRLGDDKVIPVDVRIITASNRDLKQEVDRGNFRADLYYRLSVLILHLPALRDRREDIPLLARHFVKKFSAKYGKYIYDIRSDAIEYLLQFDYPGNIRQLSNIIERSVIISRREYIDIQTIREALEEEQLTVLRVHNGSKQTEYKKTVDAKERERILDAMARCNGNKSQAAQMLGIGRSTLYRKLRKYNYPL